MRESGPFSFILSRGLNPSDHPYILKSTDARLYSRVPYKARVSGIILRLTKVGSTFHLELAGVIK